MKHPPRPILHRAALWLACAVLACVASAARADEAIPTVTMSAPPDSAAIDPAGASADEEFPVVLGAFSTTLAGSVPERTANLRRAAAALDGLILRPGDVLSFNRTVGPRTAALGYLDAPVILREVRQVQIGGGVCQVASTLFVAALQSGFGVVERWRHSSAVDYIPLGQDATISWGVKDLKLRNDLEQRVRVRVALVGATLAARFEAEHAPRESFELVSETRELPADPGVDGARPGREIELYRVRRAEGAATAREFLLRDVYPPSLGRHP